MDISFKDLIIEASGCYLCGELPEDFDEWEEEKLDAFLEENQCEEFQQIDKDDVWFYITATASSLERFLKRKGVIDGC